jgi:hypothetical protein
LPESALTIKPGKVTQSGKVELKFTTPVMVFGGGEMPGAEILAVEFLSDEVGEDESTEETDEGGNRKLNAKAAGFSVEFT